MEYGIGEIAKKTGIAISAIRYYEDIGLLPPAKRVSGKRRYDDNIFHKIRVIQLAKQAGLTTDEIHTLLHDFPDGTPPSQRWMSLAHTKIAELNERIQQIEAMKALLEKTLACECPTLEDCASDEQMLNRYPSS